MTTYNKLIIRGIEDLYFCGDIHGEYDTLQYKITGQYKLKDSAFIVCGDIALGFCNPEYYHQKFRKFNNKLKNLGSHVCFLRGNHDDPDYFNNPSTNSIFNYSNIHIIPDYTIIEVIDKYSFDPIANVLCVGGATSIDRTNRINYDLRTGKKSYWPNELPFINNEALDSINKDYKNNIHVVCTHTCPSWAWPQTKDNISYWLLIDRDLENTINIERQIMDLLFNKLIPDQANLKTWVYGHYHQHRKESINGIEYLLNDILEINPYIKR